MTEKDTYFWIIKTSNYAYPYIGYGEKYGHFFTSELEIAYKNNYLIDTISFLRYLMQSNNYLTTLTHYAVRYHFTLSSKEYYLTDKIKLKKDNIFSKNFVQMKKNYNIF